MKKINRRSFLKGGVAGTAAVATTGLSSKASAAGDFGGYPDSMGVLVDLTKCVGCRTCEAACNKEQGLPAPDLPFDDFSVFDMKGHGGQKRRTSEKEYTLVNRYDIPGRDKPIFRKFQCNHCQEPACLTSCFVNAYTKTKEGAVIYDESVCVGCRTCMVACPFYVPTYTYSSAINPVVKKCIMCYDTRLKFGRPPACVEACPQEVMTFGKRKDLINLGREKIKRNPGKYIDHIYGEKEVGGTSWMYMSDVSFDQVGFDTHLGNQPIISYVKDFLAMVPMVLTIWPALFTGFHLLSNRKKANEEKENSKS
ncbi:MAG: 4Fe-4S dicluster domain-containing protein [Desulfobulbaceae bacterium]|uniref:4Fe-4S dicluster domain-containing protein n=1 Tax=Candidatus Desulfobia pelagia TaxID=2841692 RepID=A0A8J6NFZ3_9BACT|nr:4Fe-4S dicluster domain-containing protein [Candidatus Desulfobia pelagia]